MRWLMRCHRLDAHELAPVLGASRPFDELIASIVEQRHRQLAIGANIIDDEDCEDALSIVS